MDELSIMIIKLYIGRNLEYEDQQRLVEKIGWLNQGMGHEEDPKEGYEEAPIAFSAGINALLRTNSFKSYWLAGLKETTKSDKLESDVTVYRGCDFNAMRFEDDVYMDRGLLSTSKNQKLAQKYYEPSTRFGYKAALLRIKLPKGTCCFNVESHSDFEHRNESEILLGPGAVFKVIDIQDIDDPEMKKFFNQASDVQPLKLIDLEFIKYNDPAKSNLVFTSEVYDSTVKTVEPSSRIKREPPQAKKRGN